MRPYTPYTGAGSTADIDSGKKITLSGIEKDTPYNNQGFGGEIKKIGGGLKEMILNGKKNAVDFSGSVMNKAYYAPKAYQQQRENDLFPQIRKKVIADVDPEKLKDPKIRAHVDKFAWEETKRAAQEENKGIGATIAQEAPHYAEKTLRGGLNLGETVLMKSQQKIDETLGIDRFVDWAQDKLGIEAENSPTIAQQATANLQRQDKDMTEYLQKEEERMTAMNPVDRRNAQGAQMGFAMAEFIPIFGALKGRNIASIERELAKDTLVPSSRNALRTKRYGLKEGKMSAELGTSTEAGLIQALADTERENGDFYDFTKYAALNIGMDMGMLGVFRGADSLTAPIRKELRQVFNEAGSAGPKAFQKFVESGKKLNLPKNPTEAVQAVKAHYADFKAKYPEMFQMKTRGEVKIPFAKETPSVKDLKRYQEEFPDLEVSGADDLKLLRDKKSGEVVGVENRAGEQRFYNHYLEQEKIKMEDEAGIDPFEQRPHVKEGEPGRKEFLEDEINELRDQMPYMSRAEKKSAQKRIDDRLEELKYMMEDEAGIDPFEQALPPKSLSETIMEKAGGINESEVSPPKSPQRGDLKTSEDKFFTPETAPKAKNTELGDTYVGQSNPPKSSQGEDLKPSKSPLKRETLKDIPKSESPVSHSSQGGEGQFFTPERRIQSQANQKTREVQGVIRRNEPIEEIDSRIEANTEKAAEIRENMKNMAQKAKNFEKTDEQVQLLKTSLEAHSQARKKIFDEMKALRAKQKEIGEQMKNTAQKAKNFEKNDKQIQHLKEELDRTNQTRKSLFDEIKELRTKQKEVSDQMKKTIEEVKSPQFKGDKQKHWETVKELKAQKQKIWDDAQALQKKADDLGAQRSNVYEKLKARKEEASKIWDEFKQLKEQKQKIWDDAQALQKKADDVGAIRSSVYEKLKTRKEEANKIWDDVKQLKERKAQIYEEIKADKDKSYDQWKEGVLTNRIMKNAPQNQVETTKLTPQELRIQKKMAAQSPYVKVRAFLDDEWRKAKMIQEYENVRLEDGANPYQAETNIHGRKESRDRFALQEAHEIDAIFKGDKKNYQRNKENFNQYFLAKKVLNGKEIDGMTTETAQKIVDTFSQNPKTREAYQKMVEYNKETNQMEAEYGLIDPEVMAIKKANTEKYLPEIKIEKEDGSFCYEEALKTSYLHRKEIIQKGEQNLLRKEILEFSRNNQGVYGRLFDEVNMSKLWENKARGTKTQQKNAQLIQGFEKQLEEIRVKQENLELVAQGKTGAEQTEILEKLDALKKKKADMETKKAEIPEDPKEFVAWEAETKANIKKKEAEVQKAQDSIETSLAVKAEESGIDPDTFREQVNMYVIAKHAPDFNNIHGDGAAGITTAKAKKLLADIEKLGHKKNIHKMAKEIWEWNEHSFNVFKKHKLVDEKTLKELRTLYQNHVPLRRELPDRAPDDIDFSHIPKESEMPDPIIRAKGSDLEVADIIGNIGYVNKRAEALVEYKNLYLKKAKHEFSRMEVEYKMEYEKTEQAITDYNAKLKKYETQKDKMLADQKAKLEKDLLKDQKQLQAMMERTKQKSMEVEHERELIYDEEHQSPSVINVIEEGKLTNLHVRDKALAEIYNGVNFKPKGYHTFLGKMYNRLIRTPSKKIVSFMSWQATAGNPGFWVGNFPKDLTDLLKNVSADMALKDGFQALKQTLKGKNQKAIYDLLIKNITPDAKLYKQMLLDGGTTGGFAMQSMKNIGKDWDDIVRSNYSDVYKTKKVAIDLLEGINTIIEDAPRFAAYQQALKQGKTRPQAANIAKNSTINFNKFGKGTRFASDYFMFFNPIVQGTVRELKNWKKAPMTMAQVYIGLQALEFTMSLWNHSQDEDFEKKIKPHILQKNLVMLNPFAKEGDFQYFTLPISDELTHAHNFFNSVNRMMFTKGDKIQALKDSANYTVDSLNPFGQTNTLWDFTPSAIRPITEPFITKKRFDWSSIIPSGGYWDTKPIHERYFDSTAKTTLGKISIGLSGFLHEKMGVESSPEQWKHFFGMVGGSGMQSMFRIGDLHKIPFSEEKLETKDTFAVRRFFGNPDDQEIQQNMKDYAQRQKDPEKTLLGKLFDWQMFKTRDGAVVIRAIDGDTIEVLIDDEYEKIRFANLDTPETVHPKKAAQYGGYEASQTTKKYFKPGTKIELGEVAGEQNRDIYGRLLRTIYLESGENYEELLIREGKAMVGWAYPNDMTKDLQKIEAEARKEKKGIWARVEDTDEPKQVSLTREEEALLPSKKLKYHDPVMDEIATHHKTLKDMARKVEKGEKLETVDKARKRLATLELTRLLEEKQAQREKHQRLAELARKRLAELEGA